MSKPPQKRVNTLLLYRERDDPVKNGGRSNFSRLRVRSAHLVGHLPILSASETSRTPTHEILRWRLE